MSPRYRRNKVSHRRVVADFLSTLYKAVTSGHAGIARTAEASDRLRIIAPSGGKHATGIIGESRVAGFEKMALGLVQTSAPHLYIGSIKVKHRIVGINPDRSLKHFTIVVAAFRIGLRQGVEVDIAQARGVGLYVRMA